MMLEGTIEGHKDRPQGSLVATLEPGNYTWVSPKLGKVVKRLGRP